MMSSIGRAAFRRVGAGASHQSTNQIFQTLWHLQRVRDSNNAETTSTLRQFSLALRRAYATTTKATKPKPKTSTKAKATPKARKLATKKKPAKKTIKKAVKKKLKKKIAAKPKPKKKVLTEVQKEKAALLKQKAELKALKATALAPPKIKPASAWTVLFSEHMVENNKGASTSAATAKDAAAKYKSLTASELEHYNQLANQNKVANDVAYKKWIDSHTPEEIRLANNARNLLKKRSAAKGVSVKGSQKFTLLVDPRIPKRPLPAWTLFSTTRWNSGDFKGIKLGDAVKEITKEWQALSPSERKIYEDQHAADQRRYAQEFKTVFGREADFIKTQQKATA